MARAVRSVIINSVGACIALPDDKKRASVVVAYAREKEIFFLLLPLPAKNKFYLREDFLLAIAKAEGVDEAVFLDDESRPRDICVCRAEEGIIRDFVPRDEERFAEGFCEVLSGNVRFWIEGKAEGKLYEKFTCRITVNASAPYERDSLEYAVVNAYNACLLGKVYMSDELYLETRSGKRVRIEVRNNSSRRLEENILYLRAISRDSDGFIDYYLTEDFNYNDGDLLRPCKYQIRYSNRMNGYNIT